MDKNGTPQVHIDPPLKLLEVKLRCMGLYQEKFRRELKLHLEK